MIEFTTVIGVDAKTLPQLLAAAPTWKRYRPELYDRPWVFFYDTAQLTVEQLRDALVHLGITKNVRAVAWPVGKNDYANQRERMLSGFCHVPRFVETDWWVKIDTDAVAYRHDDWCPDEWFARTPQEPQDWGTVDPYEEYALGYNVWIGSPWGYTKPAGQMNELDDWGDTVAGLKEHPRLDLPFEPGARRCIHPRMASWLSWYRTDWSKFASNLALYSCGPGKIPVPSQDGFHFYVSARRQDQVLRVKMRRRGWQNCHRYEKLKIRAAEIMENGE